MGMNSGTISLVRYRVLGLKKLSIAKLNNNLPQFQAKKIRLRGVTAPELIGWVLPFNDLDESLGPNDAWDMSHCRTDAGFALKMRMERRIVPQELLKLLYLSRVDAAERKKAKSLSRQEKKAMREALAEELLEQALPSISYVDAMWDDDRGQLLLFTASKKARELFEQLFRKTFMVPLGGTLVRVAPPLMGLSNKDWLDPARLDSALDRLAATVPTSFSAGQGL